MENIINAVVSHQHATESKWGLSSYVPEAGEIVIYDADATHNYTRQKVGDGQNKVKDLPFTLGGKSDSEEYITEEKDPTVPAWAKATKKPTYTAEEVGARPNTWMPTASEIGARPSSWTPSAEEVGARPDTWVPALKDLADDANHRTVTDAEKQLWTNRSEFSGDYNDLMNKPSIPTKISDLENDSEFITSYEDTKVTSVENHYIPDQNIQQVLVDNSVEDNTDEVINVVTGVSLAKDAAGHVTTMKTNSTTLSPAGEGFGLIKTGGDVTIDNGIITIKGNPATEEIMGTTVSITQSNTNTKISLSANDPSFVGTGGTHEEPRIISATAYGVRAQNPRFEEYDSIDNNTLFGHGDPSEISIPLEQLIRGYRDYDKATIDIQGLDSPAPHGPFEIFMYKGDQYSKEAIFANDLPIGLHPDKWERISMKSREMGGGDNKYICYYYTLGTSWDTGYISELVVRREYLNTGKVEYPEDFGVVGDRFCIPIENTPETSVPRYFTLLFTYDYEVTGATHTFADYDVTRYFETGVSSDGITPYVRFNEPTPEQDEFYEIKEYSRIDVDIRTSMEIGGNLNTGNAYPYFSNLATTNIMPVIGNAIKPVRTEAYDLGATDKKWGSIYANAFRGLADRAINDDKGNNISLTYANKNYVDDAVLAFTSPLEANVANYKKSVDEMSAFIGRKKGIWTVRKDFDAELNKAETHNVDFVSNGEKFSDISIYHGERVVSNKRIVEKYIKYIRKGSLEYVTVYEYQSADEEIIKDSYDETYKNIKPTGTFDSEFLSRVATSEWMPLDTESQTITGAINELALGRGTYVKDDDGNEYWVNQSGPSDLADVKFGIDYTTGTLVLGGFCRRVARLAETLEIAEYMIPLYDTLANMCDALGQMVNPGTVQSLAKATSDGAHYLGENFVLDGNNCINCDGKIVSFKQIIEALPDLSAN